MNIAKILPMAFVMIAGPQILSAIFLATSENWRRNSATYIAGAALSITAIVTIAYFAGSGASDAGASNDTLDIVILVLLVAAALHTIQKRTGRRLIAYVAAPYTSISSFDIPPFVDLLHDLEPDDSLDLLLQTPGGRGRPAERIILMCRKRAKGEFRVIVPDSAKSAGTLIAIAADEIVMGEPSELGPIDPQVEITTASGEAMSRPAQSFLDGLARIVAEAEEEDEISPAYFPLLDKLDPALIDFCEKALQYSKVLAARLLKEYMLKNDHGRADEIAADLVNVKKYLSHAAVIDSDRARELGLNVRFLPHDDLLWQALWRLYIDMRLTWDAPNRRLYEGQKASLLI